MAFFTFITKGNHTKACGSVIMLLDLCYERIILLNDSTRVKMGFPDDSAVKTTCNEGDVGSVPGSGRSPGGRIGNPLLYSCLENPMNRGA